MKRLSSESEEEEEQEEDIKRPMSNSKDSKQKNECKLENKRIRVE